MKRGDKKRKKHSLTFFYITKSELWKNERIQQKKTGHCLSYLLLNGHLKTD